LNSGTKFVTRRLNMTAVTSRPTAAKSPRSRRPTIAAKGTASRPPTIAAPIQGRGNGRFRPRTYF
jgi:hypothetical protein